jgi:glutaredoxin
MLEPRPQLTFYGRRGCHLCEDMRAALQGVLEERARRGELTPVIRDVDVDDDPETRERYGALVPVVALRGQELPLVMTARQLALFLDRTMPRIA